MLNSPDLITRLAGQALDRAVPETWTTLSLTQLQRFQQAFAELIVQKFQDEIWNRVITESADSNEKYLIRGVVQSVLHDVNQNFGVKA
jgi:hypothetical protein